MIWVAVFGGIALLGLLMVVGYAVWLAHKASDVMSELGVLADRLGQLAELLGRIGAEGPTPGARHVDLDRSRSRPVRPVARYEPPSRDRWTALDDRLDGEWDGDDDDAEDDDGDDPADALGGADGAYHPDDRSETVRRGGPTPVTGRVH